MGKEKKNNSINADLNQLHSMYITINGQPYSVLGSKKETTYFGTTTFHEAIKGHFIDINNPDIYFGENSLQRPNLRGSDKGWDAAGGHLNIIRFFLFYQFNNDTCISDLCQDMASWVKSNSHGQYGSEPGYTVGMKSRTWVGAAMRSMNSAWAQANPNNYTPLWTDAQIVAEQNRWPKPNFELAVRQAGTNQWARARFDSTCEIKGDGKDSVDFYIYNYADRERMKKSGKFYSTKVDVLPYHVKVFGNIPKWGEIAGVHNDPADQLVVTVPKEDEDVPLPEWQGQVTADTKGQRKGILDPPDLKYLDTIWPNLYVRSNGKMCRKRSTPYFINGTNYDMLLAFESESDRDSATSAGINIREAVTSTANENPFEPAEIEVFMLEKEVMVKKKLYTFVKIDKKLEKKKSFDKATGKYKFFSPNKEYKLPLMYNICTVCENDSEVEQEKTFKYYLYSSPYPIFDRDECDKGTYNDFHLHAPY